MFCTTVPERKLEREVFPTTAESLAHKIVDQESSSIQAPRCWSIWPTSQSDLLLLERFSTLSRLAQLQSVAGVRMGWPCWMTTDVNAACLRRSGFGAARGPLITSPDSRNGIGAGVLLEGNSSTACSSRGWSYPLVNVRQTILGSRLSVYRRTALRAGIRSCYSGRWGLPAVELTGAGMGTEAAYLASSGTYVILRYSPQRIILGGGVMGRSSCSLYPAETCCITSTATSTLQR